MGDRFLETTAYNCALIPAIFSFAVAVLAICHTLMFTAKLTFLRRLDVLFCVADMVQCSTWFVGPKYTASRITCGVQEYLWQGGMLLKCTIGTINVGLMAYVMHRRCMPTYEVVQLPIALSFAFFVIMLVLSIALDSSEVVCDGNLQGMNRGQRSHVYGFCFMLPIVIYCLSSVVLSIPSLRSIRDELGAPSLRSLVDKARAYFFLLMFMFIPTVIFLLVFEIFDHFNDVLFCIMQAAIHTGGGLACLSIIVFPIHNKHRQLNYYFISQFFDSTTFSSSYNIDRNSKPSSSSFGGFTEPLKEDCIGEVDEAIICRN